jgi:hypothetical protein
MATDGLKWVMELMDRTSSPARKIARSLDAVRVAQNSLATSAAKAAKAPDPLAHIERSMGQRRSQRQRSFVREMDAMMKPAAAQASGGSGFAGMMASGMLAVGAAALAASVAVGRITLALGHSAAEAADWRQRTEGAFQLLAGQGARAGIGSEMFQLGSRYANRFGLDVQDVQRQMVQLRAAGFEQRDMLRVMQGAGDLGALEGGGAGERAITAIRQIRAKGLLQMEELQGQLSEAGLNTGDVIAEIGRIRGLRGSGQSINSQVRALITGRRVTADQGIDAILGVIQRRSGGTLGGTLDTQSRGVGAALNRLKNSWLLLQSGFAQSTAFQRIIGFVGRLASSLDPATESGARLAAQFNRLFDVVTRPLMLSSKTSKDPFGDMFTKAIDTVERVIGAIQTLWAWGEALGGGYWSVLDPVLTGVGNAVAWVMDQLGGSETQDTLDALRLVGQVLAVTFVASLIPLGILAALVGGLVYVFFSLGDAIMSAWYWLKELMQTVLPDWVLVMLGVDRPEARPAVNNLQPALAGATGMVGMQPGASVLRPTMLQPNVNVQVHAQAAEGVSAEDIGSAAAAAVSQAALSAGDAARGVS